MSNEKPVLDTIAAMTAASLQNCSLDAREHMLVRLAALVAADAPPLSYLANAEAAGDVGVTAEDVQNILVAVAPIAGTTRVVAAARNITRALGLAIAVADAEIAGNEDG
jgi:alkylhydroperoxidase/carboxymuconolactone decarboxylase family protein YurZ